MFFQEGFRAGGVEDGSARNQVKDTQSWPCSGIQSQDDYGRQLLRGHLVAAPPVFMPFVVTSL